MGTNETENKDTIHIYGVAQDRPVRLSVCAPLDNLTSIVPRSPLVVYKLMGKPNCYVSMFV